MPLPVGFGAASKALVYATVLTGTISFTGLNYLKYTYNVTSSRELIHRLQRTYGLDRSDHAERNEQELLQWWDEISASNKDYNEEDEN
jgi:hypothetical protein